MKFTYAMFFAFLVVVAAVSPSPAHAGAGKIIIKAPDPTCPPPAGTLSIGSVQQIEAADGDGTLLGGVVPGEIDGSTAYGFNNFANCTGQTLDVLVVNLDNIPIGKGIAIDILDNPLGNAFDGGTFTIGDSLTSGIVTLYCDPSFFDDKPCTGLSGTAGANGVSFIVNMPEPADGALLLFGIGGIALLGLGGRKVRKQLVTA